MRIIHLSIIICLVLIAAACGNSAATAKVIITKQQYEKIKDGMTYKEVIEVIGGEGEIVTETGEKGSNLYGISVKYEGKKNGSLVHFVFLGDKLKAKTQYGME